jgi:WD40 repeat protein
MPLQVRIYDEATKTMVTSMGGGLGAANYNTSSPGHSNRVFSLKFSPVDENVLFSGGWDNTVQMWDLRTETAVRSLFGPHICGDSMDVKGDTILTGSWRPENTLEVSASIVCDLALMKSC